MLKSKFEYNNDITITLQSDIGCDCCGKLNLPVVLCIDAGEGEYGLNVCVACLSSEMERFVQKDSVSIIIEKYFAEQKKLKLP